MAEHGKGSVAILGFGNRLWRDDGAGSVLAERLKAAHPQATVFDGGMVPENYLEKVAATNPEKVILIDAADFGGVPGEWRVFEGEDLALTGVSTHAGSPRILAAYLQQRTGAVVKLVAIQSSDEREGAGLTKAVQAAVIDVIAWLENNVLESG